MFSGIVEATGQLIHFKRRQDVYELCISKPKNFNDLKNGDSVSVDGVCLTVESLARRDIVFAVTAETLRFTGWSRLFNSPDKVFNLERSVSFGARVHGHFVTGHVDGVGQVIDKVNDIETCRMVIDLPESLMSFAWDRGTLALNGVSLTIHVVRGNRVHLNLIPESLKRTNLWELQIGDRVCIEMDMMAKSVVNYIENLNPKEYFLNILMNQIPKPVNWFRHSVLGWGELTNGIEFISKSRLGKRFRKKSL